MQIGCQALSLLSTKRILFALQKMATHTCTRLLPQTHKRTLRHDLRFLWLTLFELKSDSFSFFSLPRFCLQRVAVCSYRHPSLKVHCRSLKSVPLRESAEPCLILAGGGGGHEADVECASSSWLPKDWWECGSSANISAVHLRAAQMCLISRYLCHSSGCCFGCLWSVFVCACVGVCICNVILIRSQQSTSHLNVCVIILITSFKQDNIKHLSKLLLPCWLPVLLMICFFLYSCQFTLKVEQDYARKKITLALKSNTEDTVADMQCRTPVVCAGALCDGSVI